MQAVADRAESTLVTNQRGADIQRRLTALNLSDRDFERRTGVERKTLRRAIDEGDRTRESTWRSIETALDRLEARFRGEPTVAPEPAETDLVSFELSGDFGVHVVVKGPVRDRVALEESVARLIREMRSRGGDD